MKTDTSEQTAFSQRRHEQIEDRLRQGFDLQARCLLRRADREALSHEQLQSLLALAHEHDCPKTEAFLQR